MSKENLSIVGKDVPRIDAADKAFGRVKYTNDISIPGVLHAKLLNNFTPQKPLQFL